MPVLESALLVPQAIQLCVAPVFPLTGIAGPRGVMAHGLARIIDRARELASLERRRQLASGSINCCTGAAWRVCTVIVALSCVLAEVYLAAHASRIDAQAFER